MNKTVVAILAILLMLAEIQIAAAFTFDPETLKDSKTETLSIRDKLFLRPEILTIGMATAKVLVNRLTHRVEYVWSYGSGCYVRPRFIMPNAQDLYDQMHAK